MNCHKFQTRLHAYMDGVLDMDETLAGDTHTAECPACLSLAERETQFRQLLRRQPRESAPAELRARIVTLCRRKQRQSELRPWLMASTLAAAAMLVAFLMLPRPMPFGSREAGLIGSLVDKHIVYSQLERPAEFVSTDHLEYEAWFQEQVGLRVTVPDYSSAGIRLVGARIAEADERKVAYVLYQKGHVLLSVFIASGSDHRAALSGSPTSYRGQEYLTRERKGYRTVSWQEGTAVISLVSMLDYAALLECAEKLRAERAREARL